MAPTPRRDNHSVRSQRGSMRSQGRSEADRMPQTPTTVDRAYDARSARSGGSAKSGKSAAFRRDSSLSGFMKRLRDIEILSDVALGKIRASGHKMPGDLEAFLKRKDEVLRCMDEMKGLPGAEQILSGKVSDEMFRELRYTSRYIDEFNKMSLIPMNTLLGSSLSSWLVSDETLDKNPAVMNLRQLRETCESLQTIEEILTSQLSVLNWDVGEAMTPPPAEIIVNPKDVAVGLSSEPSGSPEESTCCFCCSSAPIEAPPPPPPRGKSSSRGRDSPASGRSSVRR